MKVDMTVDVWYDGEENTVEGVKEFVKEAIKVAEESCGSCGLNVLKCECLDEQQKKAYVLMEQDSYESMFSQYDVMGITYDRQKAIDWVNNNPEFRRYKEAKEIE